MGMCATCMGLSVYVYVHVCIVHARVCICVCVFVHMQVCRNLRSRLWRSCGERSLDMGGGFRVGSVTRRRKWESIAQCVCANPPQEASARQGGM